MKAIVLKTFGAADQLMLADLPVPTPKENEVLVKVRAISINPVDAKTRKGKGQAAHIRNDTPMILGWDIAGDVVDTGPGVISLKKGDAVFGMINLPGHGKAYAEFVAAPVHHLVPKPQNISYEEAAAASLAAITAWQALVTHGRMQPGQRVLIQAAAGGVGHYAVQIARALGAHVIGTASAENRAFVLSLGAHEHVEYKNEGWQERIAPVDLILEAIGGNNIDASLKALKSGGTIVSLPSGLSDDVGDKAAKQGKKGIFFLVQSNQDDLLHIASMLEKGSIRSQVTARYRLEEIDAAHEQIETGKTKGKIVVLM